jgi:signal transduction histidine kinase
MATMSHELRTPLNAIIGYTEIQLAGITGPLNPKQQAHQERVLANAEHLLNLINEILDLAKVEAGRLKLLQEPFPVKTWLGDVVQQVQGLADDKKLRLESIVDPHLPDMLIGDVGRLKQIVINLLSNAIKFTDVGLVEIKLARKDAETWTIKVTDTGVGIPAHALEYIFDEFQQVDGSSRRGYGGTGLGLAIVRKLAILMGGNIRVKSQVGFGSAFTVILPLLTENMVEAERQEEA